MYSIIVPVYDPLDLYVPAEVLPRMVANVLSLEGDFELILVNNSPSDAGQRTTEYLRTLPSQHPSVVKLVEMSGNRGTARGFNAGLAVARADSRYLVFMSTDAQVVDNQVLSKIRAVMDGDPRIGILHPISVFEDSDPYNYSSRFGSRRYVSYLLGRSGIRPELTDREARELCDAVSRRPTSLKRSLPTFPLTFAVIRREMIERIGSFDNGIERGCHENNDLAYRALLSGFDVVRLDNAFINHRRLLFHTLTVDPSKRATRPHAEAIIQSAAWWNEKWERPYDELYARWRVGPIVFPLLKPYFWAKRIVSRLVSR